jgi:hypothetical protein
MTKAKNVTGFIKNRYVKCAYFLICTVLAIATIVCFVISITGYIGEKKRLAAMDENLNSLVQISIDTSQQAIEKWGEADEETLDFVNDYVVNINAAESARQKSYIAQSMLAYVAKLITFSNFFMKEDADEAAGEDPTPIMTYDRLEAQMNDLTVQLNAARDFDRASSQSVNELNETETETNNN